MKQLLFILAVAALVLSGSSVLAQTCITGYCPCKGNFDCDKDVDGGDAAVFKQFYGVSPFNAVCRPHCQALVPQTGQTTSYATGDDGDLEKGIEWEDPRFYDNEDGTVTDGLTGLVWIQNANCFGTRTWNSALSDCNGLASGSCGITDGSSSGEWRLPNSKELFSLVDAENWSPALPSGHPFTNVEYSYWSSTTYANNSDSAWLVHMNNGGMDNGTKFGEFGYVLCVRGGQ